MTQANNTVIAIAGAGSVGCYVGGMLAHAGREVRFLARPRIMQLLRENGLRLTDSTGFDALVAAEALAISTEPSILSDADIVIVTVKSAATETIAREISAHARPDAIIISLQNGVTNAERLQSVLPDHDIRAGMIAYNVLNAGEGRFHKGTSGNIVIEEGPGAVASLLSAPPLDVFESSDMSGVQWGKLLINLNNALNALSNRPLRDQLMDHAWRRILADQISEALPALERHGVSPRSATPLPTKYLPHIMRLPNPLYRLIASASLKIDPEARSSMWEDLQAGRKTEIDELQGAVIDLCEKYGLSAPVNRRVFALIRECETGVREPGIDPVEVRHGLRQSKAPGGRGWRQSIGTHGNPLRHAPKRRQKRKRS